MTGTEDTNPEQQSSSRRLWRRLVWSCVVIVVVAIGVGIYRHPFRGHYSWRSQVADRGGSVFVGRSENRWAKQLFGERFVKTWQDAHHVVLKNAREEDYEHLLDCPLCNHFNALIVVDSALTEKELNSIAEMNQLQHLTLDGPSDVSGVQKIHGLTSLETIEFHECQFRASEAKKLGEIPKLKTIAFRDTIFEVGAIEKLHVLNDLESLGIDDSHINNKELQELSTLKHLRGFSSRYTNLSDEGLVFLEAKKNLSFLSLVNTKITNRGLRVIPSLINLRDLTLSNNLIGDDWLPYLEGLTGLNSLDLSDTNVTDAGLTSIGKVMTLEELILDDTHITNAGLHHLYSLYYLRRLNLSGTRVTPSGVNELQKKLPRCDISY